MKKFLALVLALVMTMSLVTVASAKDFTDDADINYDEAVAVISALGVVGGYADGSFNPDGGLTRQAAAKIICNMILGPTTAAELDADTNPYPDVDKDSDFAGYIAYCQKEGIISGYADGTFKGANGLTGYAFMKMLLGALGYDADVEGYTGANWSINVAKKAIGIGLNDGLKADFNGSDYVTREEAALYAFNTLKATMVDYESKATVNVNGASVVVAGSTAEEVEWVGYNNADGNVKGDDLVQFGEKYFAKLKGTPDVDAFGRPATKWVFNKKDVGTYVNYEELVASYTTTVEGGDIYADMGSTAAKYPVAYYVDGELQAEETAADLDIYKKSDVDFATSGNGVLVEVYVNDETEDVTIVVVNTYLAEVTSDYSEKNESIKVAVYNKGNNTTTAKTVKLENVANVADFEDGDLVLVTIADGAVMSMVAPEVVAETTITTYSTTGDAHNNGDKMTKITADGVKYEAAKTAGYDAAVLNNYDLEQLDDTTFNVYLDQYGYVIGLEIVDAAVEYIFVASYENSTSSLSKVNDKAAIITVDGTMAVVEVKQNDLITRDASDVNTWFEYTMDGDVYVLEAVAEKQLVDTNKGLINASNTTLTNDGKVFKFGNSKSAYITVDIDDDFQGEWITDVETVVTGIKNTDIDVTGNVYAMYNTNGYVTYAVVVGEDNTSTNNLVYITSDAVVDKTYVNKDTGYVYTYNCIIAGEETTVQVKSDAAAVIAGNGHALYKMTYDANGYAKKVELKSAQAVGLMNTALLETQGYFVTNNKEWKVTADGATLYVKDVNNNASYVILDDECNYFVYNVEGEAEYVEFADVEEALNETGNANTVTGTIVVLADTDSGYATTVIIYDAAFEAEEEIADKEEPAAPTSSISYTVRDGKLVIVLKGMEAIGAINTIDNQFIGDMLAADGCTNIKVANGEWSFDKGYESFSKLTIAHDLVMP